jgi:hypothetical protein
MHNNPWSQAGFKTQICCLVLAPSFLAAGIYVTLKHLVIYCGPEHSRLKPRLIPWIFIGCDFGSIVLQAIGGGTAAAAGNHGQNKKLLDAGDALIVAGIAFQVATMAVCGVFMLDYFIRFQRAKKAKSAAHLESEYEKNTADPKTSRNFRIFCFAIGLAFLTIFIRCVYRYVLISSTLPVGTLTQCTIVSLRWLVDGAIPSCRTRPSSSSSMECRLRGTVGIQQGY